MPVPKKDASYTIKPEPVAESPQKKEAIEAADPDGGNTGITFKYDGEIYTVPAVQDWSLDVMEQFEESHGTLLLRELLGPEQWQKFRATHNAQADRDALYDQLNAAIGVVGN